MGAPLFPGIITDFRLPARGAFDPWMIVLAMLLTFGSQVCHWPLSHILPSLKTIPGDDFAAAATAAAGAGAATLSAYMPCTASCLTATINCVEQWLRGKK